MSKWKYQAKYLPFIILAAGIVIFLLLLLIRGQQASPQPTTESITVKVKKITPGLRVPQIRLIGSVQSPRYTKLEAAVTAYVKATPVLPGEKVKKGQVVIYLDDRDALNIYRQKQAAVDDFNAQLKAELSRYQSDKQSFEDEKRVYDLTKKDVDRMVILTQKKLTAAVDLDKAQKQLRLQALILNKRRLALQNYQHRFAQLQAKLAQAIAQRDQAELDWQRTKIIAPFSGRLINLSVSVGDRVHPGEILAEIYDTQAIEVHAQIPNRYVADFETAMQKNAVLSAKTKIYNKEITLKLDRLGSEIKKGRGAIDAIFNLEDKKTYLPIGLSLHLVVNMLPVNNAIDLPSSALYGNQRIYRVLNQHLQGITVKHLGDRFINDGGQEVIVSSPQLKAGDLIATTYLPNAMTGLKVKIINEN